MTAGEEIKKYEIKPTTMAYVFQFHGIVDLSDLQKVFDAVELGMIAHANDVRNQTLSDAVGLHALRVLEIINDEKSFKNGKVTKSAKRAAAFHERSAKAIEALKEFT